MTEHGKRLAENDALSKVRFYIVFMFVGCSCSTVRDLFNDDYFFHK